MAEVYLSPDNLSTEVSKNVDDMSFLSTSSDESLQLPHVQATVESILTSSVQPLVSVRDIPRLPSARRVSDSSSSFIGCNHFSNDRRPALISVQIHRASMDLPLGVEFQVADNVPIISAINPTGVFAGSPIQPGDTLIRLGDATSIAHNSAEELARYLKKSTGNITVTVKNKNGVSGTAEAVVFKQTASSPIGLSFTNKKGRLQISKIAPTGLLGSNCVLKVGDCIESINFCNATELDLGSAEELIKSTVGFTFIRVRSSVVSTVSVKALPLSIGLSDLNLEQGIVTAEEIDSPRFGNNPTFDTFGEQPSLVSILTYKTIVDSDLGIELQKVPASRTTEHDPCPDKLEISHVSDRGLFSKFPLEVGDVVMAINYRSGYDLTPQEAVEILQQSEYMYMVVQKSHGKPGLLHAIATAPREVPEDGFKLGMTFRTGRYGSLEIGTMHSWCLLMDSVLGDGDILVGINGIPSEHLDISEAVAIVRRPTEHFAFLARTSRSRAAVLSGGRGAAVLAAPRIENRGVNEERSSNPEVVYCLVLCVVSLVIVIKVI
eukprot:Nitzschia sp. Nitz4//scaffold154_size52827//5748//7391//NITZ4_006770-RA/size52827-processed-gene-0.52-mRNA-1//-1//CDS//3329537290//7059//frame0